MIIGISGKLGSGKSFIAKQIISRLSEYNFKEKSFADNLKKIVSILTGIDIKKITTREIKQKYLHEWDMTVGEMFQKLGTDCIRNHLNNNAWIISTFSKYTEEQNWIISDVRFINEADYVKKLGGILIRLEGDPLNIRQYDPRNSNHSSENELDNYDNFDMILENSIEVNIDNLLFFIEKKLKK
jgi:hypothetical protein